MIQVRALHRKYLPWTRPLLYAYWPVRSKWLTGSWFAALDMDGLIYEAPANRPVAGSMIDTVNR
jgi:hypothetical protein